MKNLFKAPASSHSAEFYDGLVEGSVTRGILGKDARFNAIRVSQSPSVQKYFIQVVQPYLNPAWRVLDFGCGPGSFMAPIAGDSVRKLSVSILASNLRSRLIAQADTRNRIKKATVEHD